MEKPLSEKLAEIAENMGGVLTDFEKDVYEEVVEKLKRYENLSQEVSDILQAELELRIVGSENFLKFYDRNVKVIQVKFKIN